MPSMPVLALGLLFLLLGVALAADVRGLAGWYARVMVNVSPGSLFKPWAEPGPRELQWRARFAAVSARIVGVAFAAAGVTMLVVAFTATT